MAPPKYKPFIEDPYSINIPSWMSGYEKADPMKAFNQGMGVQSNSLKLEQEQEAKAAQDEFQSWYKDTVLKTGQEPGGEEVYSELIKTKAKAGDLESLLKDKQNQRQMEAAQRDALNSQVLNQSRIGSLDDPELRDIIARNSGYENMYGVRTQEDKKGKGGSKDSIQLMKMDDGRVLAINKDTSEIKEIAKDSGKGVESQLFQNPLTGEDFLANSPDEFEIARSGSYVKVPEKDNMDDISDYVKRVKRQLELEKLLGSSNTTPQAGIAGATPGKKMIPLKDGSSVPEDVYLRVKQQQMQQKLQRQYGGQ